MKSLKLVFHQALALLFAFSVMCLQAAPEKTYEAKIDGKEFKIKTRTTMLENNQIVIASTVESSVEGTSLSTTQTAELQFDPVNHTVEFVSSNEAEAKDEDEDESCTSITCPSILSDIDLLDYEFLHNYDGTINGRFNILLPIGLIAVQDLGLSIPLIVYGASITEHGTNQFTINGFLTENGLDPVTVETTTNQAAESIMIQNTSLNPSENSQLPPLSLSESSPSDPESGTASEEDLDSDKVDKNKSETTDDQLDDSKQDSEDMMSSTYTQPPNATDTTNDLDSQSPEAEVSTSAVLGAGVTNPANTGSPTSSPNPGGTPK